MMNTNELVRLDKIADYISGDSDLWITSRYERLHLINLLAAQERLSRIDQDINEHLNLENCLINGEQRIEPRKPSAQILSELRDAIKAYGDAISSLATLKHSEYPDHHVVGGLRKTSADYIPSSSIFHAALVGRKGEDVTSSLLSTVIGPRSWFHRYVARHRRLSLAFRDEQQAKYKEFTKFSEKKLKTAEFAIVAICLCLVQLLPVLALTLVSGKAVRLAIIVVLILLVSILNAAFANTVRATNFGAIAAYSAIVVVFISQSN